MTLDELKDALVAADPAAVLLPGHLLARVIREVNGVPAQVIQVPHRKSFIVDRAVLLRYVDLDDLDLGPDRLLPSKVILLARPAPERRNLLERETTLLKYWRRLFHASVHLHLERLAAEGSLGPAEVAARVEAVGTTEFEEARNVLDQEGYLFPRATTRDIYIEFAAVYLEFLYFVPDLLPVYFPGIRDHRRVEQVLVRDVDAAALFQRTRLVGASGPVPQPDASTDEPTEACAQLMRDARRAGRAGNGVRAAILRIRAARIAPAAITAKLRQEVEADLDQLTGRLRDALKLTDEERAEWRKVLAILLDKTGEEHRSVEARLLRDLQNACVDHEREVYALDLVEWVISVGKRPIKRPLGGQRAVRITRHLRSAAQRLSSTRLSETDRQHLGRLLSEAQRQNEERLRARFRPVLSETLRDVGLTATNAPEQAAFSKLVEELLDRISDLGFFTFSDLRDAISRNNLKLPDLADPTELISGDPLLHLDRLLASSPLDGVYRPSEIYLRLLQRLTAPNFGTRLGRMLTRYVTIPFGLALVILEGMDLLVREGHRLFGGVYRPLFGPISVLVGLLLPRSDAAHLPEQERQVVGPAHFIAQSFGAQAMDVPGAWAHQLTAAGVVDSGVLTRVPSPADLVLAPEAGRPLTPYVAPSLWLLLGLLILGLIYVPAVRRAFAAAGRRLLRACRVVFVEWPLQAVPWPQLRAFLKSWPLQLIYRLVVKPLPVYLLLWWFVPTAFETWLNRVVVFAAIVGLLNSRPGRGLEEAVARGLLQLLNWLRAGLVDGLFRLIVQVFKGITDGLEYVLYTVDEWLRFRGGESRLSMVVRAVLGVIWFPVSYVTRLYIVVLVEPGFNPLKAPISIVAAKFVYPIILALEVQGHLTTLLEPLLGSIASRTLIYSTLWLLPDAFGFLFWEMKENWKLYRANRPKVLEPAPVGPYGETMLRLLKPGFHSGTLPKLFAQLRRAERSAHEAGARRAPRTVRQRLDAVDESLRRFVTRDVLALLQLSPEWHKKPLNVGEVALASNQVRIELRHADYGSPALRLAISEQDGLLMAGVEESGWLRRLTSAEATTLDQAIAGMYKLAGVDLVREHDGAFPQGIAGPVPEEGIQPAPSPAANGAADRDGKVVIFRRVSLPWAQWVDWWRHDRAGEPLPPPFPVLPVTLNGPNEAARNPGESSTAFRAGEPTAPRPENSL
jgi:hypothetical protein